MAQHVTHLVTEPPAPGSDPGRARLLLGAVTVAVGLFVGLHWLGLPGAQLSLDRNRHRTDSVAALEQAAANVPRRTPASARGGSSRTATRSSAVNKALRRRGTALPRKAGKPISSQPRKPQPGSTPPAASSDTVEESSPEPGKTVLPSPPPPSPPPAGSLPVEIPKTPQLPQLPQLPQVPQVPPVPPVPPVPSLPDLPKPKVPGVPTPQLPTLP